MLYTDLAIAVVHDEDGTAHKILIPVILHETSGIVWEGEPLPLGPYGLKRGLEFLIELTAEMKCYWPEAAANTIWLGDQK